MKQAAQTMFMSPPTITFVNYCGRPAIYGREDKTVWVLIGKVWTERRRLTAKHLVCVAHKVQIKSAMTNFN